MAKKPTYEELEQKVKKLKKEIIAAKNGGGLSLKSESLLKAIMENAPALISAKDLEGNVIVVNRRFEILDGPSPEDFIGKNVYDLFPFHIADDLWKNDLVALTADAPVESQESVFHKNGIMHTYHTVKFPLYGNTDKAFGTCAISVDVTGREDAEKALRKAHDDLERKVEERTVELHKELQERKRAEEALRESEETALALLNAPTDSAILMDLEGNFIALNETAAKRLESSVDELVGKCGYDLMPLDLAESRKKRVLHVAQTKSPVRFQDERAGIIHDVNLYPIFDERGEVERIAVFAADITERVKTEEALRESEVRFSAMFEHMSSGVAVYESVDNGEDFVFRAFNPAAEGITRISRNEALGNSLLDIFPQMDKSGLLGTLQRVRKTGREEYIPPFYYKDEKREGWRENRIYKLPTGEVVALFDDVTERKQAEEALRKSEEKYRSMMESMDDPVYICSPDYHVEYMNPAMIKKTEGLNAVGELCYKAIHELDEKCPWCVHDEVQQGENQLTEMDSPKDNRTYNVSHFPVHNADGSISKLTIYRDVTETRKMEAQFRRATKMEAIANLAGGIAHEFNNALMGVMGNIDLLKMDLPEDEGRTQYFEAMNESGQRMSRLTAQLLAYSEGGKYSAKNLKLDDFVIETLPILQHDLSPEVRVETDFPKDISYIRADHAQMQMVLSAIVANSNEAIEDEGLIKIAAENKDIDEDFTKQHPGLKPGPYACLSIEDDGKGMDEETKNGIFEPFFTTKFQGRGMGMAAVYGIIKSHDGAITVDSEPGKGTVVRIYLPAIEVKEEVKKVKQPEVEIATGEGTILVIEDEEPLVKLFRQILERLGYRVLVAETGKEAVEFAKTFDGQIDLALLDIKLPDMDGGRVYPLIMEARPDLKVIVCSGYSIHGPAQDILDAGAEGFMQKPFPIATLAEKLKEVLEGK